MARFMRFYGFRRIAASVIGGILMWLAVKILGSTPPAYWHEWPQNASLALSNLVGGSLAVAFFAWIVLLVKPLLKHPSILSFLSYFAIGTTAISGIGGVWQCLVGGFYLLNGEEGCIKPILGEWMRVVGWPLLIGSAPILLLEIYEQATVSPSLRRWLFSGKGHAATWARPAEMRGMAKPMTTSPNSSSGFSEEY